MRFQGVALVLSAALTTLVHAQASSDPGTVVLTGADRRPAVSLDGEWHTIIDPYGTGLYSFHHEQRKDGWFLNRHYNPTDNTLVEYDFAKSPTLRVPGDWNTQRDALFFYDGIVWYQKDFTWHHAQNARHTFLHIGAANYQSHFWINGKKICDHEGGFTTFDCDATAALHDGDNFIVAAVDSTRQVDGLPTLQTDWWNYGGLTRSVSLIDVPTTYIEHYDLHLDRATRSKIEGYVQLAGKDPAPRSVTVSIPELGAKLSAEPDSTGKAIISMPVPRLQAWTPEHPKLYRIDLSSRPTKWADGAQALEDATDTLHDELGFKTIEVRGTEILLNGKPIFLRGISIHAEAPYRTGRANTEQDMDTLLGWAKDLGCNFVRLAHYPHDEKMTRAADRLGLLVWSEIPVYWAVQFDNPAVLAKAKHMLAEEIDRDRNRASIAFWSIANETPNNPARTDFLTTLAGEARTLDPTRLITAALLVHSGSEPHTKVIDDPLGAALDVIGFNEYIGWYEGTPETADQTTWRVSYQKPLIVSEFGGGAKTGLHGSPSQRWTEEYQASIYQHQLPMLNKIPQLRGMTPWLLMDFRAPARQLPGIQDYFNRKGLLSDQGVKKEAFSVLQKAYHVGSIGKAQ